MPGNQGQSGDPRRRQVNTVTAAAYTADVTDEIIFADATSNAITVTIPSAASMGAGFRLSVAKTDSSGNAVTVARTGSDTFDGSTSVSLAAQFNSVVLVSNGGTLWKRGSNAVATGGI